MGTQALAQGPWQVIQLHPPGMYDSQGLAAGGGLQGGQVRDNAGYTFPALWNGSAGSYVNMLPPGGPYQIGNVYGMSGNHQVGVVVSTTALDAGLWTGTPESFVSLSPHDSRYIASEAYAVSGNQQVGWVSTRTSNLQRACVWNGSAESFIDLHPAAGYTVSVADATDGTRQSGYVRLAGSGAYHAALWTSSAASLIDMNPVWATGGSSIRAMAGNVQVGGASVTGLGSRAILWQGTPNSWVDLTPPLADDASLLGTNGIYHVGSASFGGGAQAGIWLGHDASSFFNLQDILGPGWQPSSVANAVSVSGGYIDVVGTATPIGGRAEAVLWRMTVPTPGSLGVLIGGLISFSTMRRRKS